MSTKEIIKKLDQKTLLAIKRQAEYNNKSNAELRIEISFNHLDGLKKLKKDAKRI